MKILQVITSLLIGGAEKLIVDMAPLMQSQGHTVDVLVFHGAETPFAQKLREYGIKVIALSEGGNVYNPRYIHDLCKILPQYDVVHTHNTACQYFVAVAKKFCKCNAVKFVTTEHNTTNRRRNLFGFKQLDWWMYRQYQDIAAISDKAKENLQNFIGVSFGIHTIYNGINLEVFEEALPLTNDTCLKKEDYEIILCMVAGFRDQKDQDTLIKSLTYLPNNYKLWLIGDGERRVYCENLANSLDLSKRVVFAGIRSDIPNILKTADVIIMSSHFEGLSLSSIEGMCVGKPFIASDVDGLHEIVAGNGVLFPHEDDQALANEIKKLAENKEYAKQIADRCLQKAKQYDINKTVKAYLDIYQKLV